VIAEENGWFYIMIDDTIYGSYVEPDDEEFTISFRCYDRAQLIVNEIKQLLGEI
jgi:hypothetical protein